MRTADMCYSRDAIALWADLFSFNAGFWKMSWEYRSNWRVLHIDNFEGGGPLPKRYGRKLQFFNCEKLA